MKRIYTSIDLGTDSIKIVVCELFHNKLNLLAASTVKSEGIKKGLITDSEALSISIKKGIREIEQMLGISIKKVIAMLPNYDVDYVIGDGSKKINENVTSEDINDILKMSASGKIKEDKELVTIIPIDFAIDNLAGIKDPKNREGNVLKVRTIVVSAPKKNIYSLISILEKLNLEVIDISLSSIGDYYSFKNKENASAIGAVVNIGYETTNIALFNKGIIYKSSILQIGGKNIDNDISYMYKISPEEASKIKEKFAFAHTKHASQNQFFETIDEEGNNIKINQFEVSNVVMSRLEEILEIVRKEINTLTKSQVNYIILTGGTSSLSRFSTVIESTYKTVGTLGDIKILGVRNNKYSPAIGNIVYFINKLKLKGLDYTMVDDKEANLISSTQKSLLNISSDSMLGKVFGYFFGD